MVTWPWLKSNVSRSWYNKQCTPLGIHYSTWSKHGGKERDRRREKDWQFSFSWMNTTTWTQTRSLKLKGIDFQSYPRLEEKQQLVEEKDADNIRKVLCKSFILMYKVNHNLCPRTICDMFLTNSQNYNLRQKDFYQPSFNAVTHGKQSIRYLGPRLWSKIPSKDRSVASLKQFKTRIRSLDLTNILDGCSGCYLCNS